MSRLRLLLPLLASLMWAADNADEFTRLLPLPMERGTAERLLTERLGRLPPSSHTLRLGTQPSIAVYRLDARRSLILEFPVTRDPVGNIGASDLATTLRLTGIGAALANVPEPLRSDILLIQEAPKIEAGDFRGDLLLGAAIRLHRLGRERALAALSGYLGLLQTQMADDSIDSTRAAYHWAFECDWDGGRVHLLARLIFRPRKGQPAWAPPGLGGPSPAPTDRTALPLFPLAICDGLPFLATRGYCLAGMPEPPEDAVEFARAACDLTADLPRPTRDPLAIAELAAGDAALLGAYAPADRNDVVHLLRLQAIRIRLGLGIGADPDYHGCSSHEAEDALRWQSALAEASAAPLRWDDDAAGYVGGRE